MKRNYLVDIQLPEELDDDFITRIPQQRMVVNKLMEKGIITTYALSADRTKLWIVIQSESPRMVKEILQKMPLYNYMEILIHELAFHESPSFLIPQPSLN